MSAANRIALPPIPAELQAHSAKLAKRLRETIAQHGPLSFADFMEMALYEPGLGYYSSGLRRFGADGDFITAPELGGVFGHCLATATAPLLRQLAHSQVVELGPGSGVLAEQLLRYWRELDSLPAEYRLLERSAGCRQQQSERLRDLSVAPTRLSWIDDAPATPFDGLILANEVLDALPVDRYVLDAGQWRRLRVALNRGDEFALVPAEPANTAVLEALPNAEEREEGFLAEYCPSLEAWLEHVTANLRHGACIWIDYGDGREQLYDHRRSRGTLNCHLRHRVHDDALLWPGLQDITSFVDFSRVAEALQAAGFEIHSYCHQSAFLTASGLAELGTDMAALSDTERWRLAQEIKQLTMPSDMGERFKVMIATRGPLPDYLPQPMPDLRASL